MSRAAIKKRTSRQKKAHWKALNRDEFDKLGEVIEKEQILGYCTSLLKDSELYVIDKKSSIHRDLAPRILRRLRGPREHSLLKPHSKYPGFEYLRKKPNPLNTTKEEKYKKWLDRKTKKIRANKPDSKNEEKQLQESNKILITQLDDASKFKESETTVPNVTHNNENENILKRKMKLKSIKTYNRKAYEWGENKACDVDFSKDLWGTQDKVLETVKNDEWLTENSKLQILQTTFQKHPSVKCPIISKVKSKFAPVEIAHPGSSYNPSKDDHDQLIEKIVSKELLIKKKEDKVARSVAGFTKMTPKQIQDSWMVEMSEGLSKPDEFMEDNDYPNDSEYSTANPPVKCKIKLASQRRRHKEHLIRLAQQRREKDINRRMNEIGRVKTWNKVVEAEQILGEHIRTLNKLKKQDKRLGIRKIGGKTNKVEEMEDALADKGDLTGNLRGVRRQGGSLRERFQSLMMRNVIEPRSNKTKVPKAKMKLKTRIGLWDHVYMNTISRPDTMGKTKRIMMRKNQRKLKIEAK